VARLLPFPKGRPVDGNRNTWYRCDEPGVDDDRRCSLKRPNIQREHHAKREQHNNEKRV
jgi:hypothetical protein